jgi:hypothetical protein
LKTESNEVPDMAVEVLYSFHLDSLRKGTRRSRKERREKRQNVGEFFFENCSKFFDGIKDLENREGGKSESSWRKR